MVDFRLYYYLIGGILFLIPKVVSSFNFWGMEAKKDPKIDRTSLFYFMSGIMFLTFVFHDLISTLLTNNLPIIMGQYSEILPMIFLSLISITFMIESLIKPTKNSLLTLLISGGACLSLIITLFHMGTFPVLFGTISEYLGYLGVLIGLFAGLISSIYLLKYFKKKKPENDKELCSLDRTWNVFNNSYFLSLLLILSCIEVWLQAQGNTLLYFVSQFF